MEFYKQATRYLQNCRIKVSNTYVRERMQSHPNYPALVAFTDTLDDLAIPYSASVCDKEQYEELSYPLLAHIVDDGRNDFIPVYKPTDFTENQRGILDNWDGVSLYIAPASVITNADHNTLFVKEKKQTATQLTVFFILASLLLIMAGIHVRWVLIGLQLLSIVGAIICGMILLHRLGKDNAFTEQLCAADSGHGCHTVLQSKAAAWKGISLGDAGIVYFVGFAIYVAVASLVTNPAGLNLLIVPVASGIIVAIASFLYQWLVVKAWCRMCLSIDLVLCLQAIVTYLMLEPNFSINIGAESLLLVAFSFLLPATAWGIYKQKIQQYDSAENEHIKALRFKRMPEVFLSLLQQQRQVDITPWEDDIVLGNPQASLQLMVACNPYCGPCAKAHKEMEELLFSYPDEIGITIRFTVKADLPVNKKTMAVSHIVAAWQNGHKNAVDAWFDQMDLEPYRTKFPGEPKNLLLSETLQKHAQWTVHTKITHTPTFFLNGYEWPKMYKLTDLKTMLKLITENIAASTVVANTESVA